MIKIEERGNLTVIEFTESEPGQASLVDQIEAKLDAVIANPNSNEIVINLSQVTVTGTLFLSMLQKFDRRATAYGLKVSLSGVSKHVAATLKMVGLGNRVQAVYEAA